MYSSKARPRAGLFFRASELATNEQHGGNVRGVILQCTPTPEVAAAQGLLEILDTKSSETRTAYAQSIFGDFEIIDWMIADGRVRKFNSEHSESTRCKKPHDDSRCCHVSFIYAADLNDTQALRLR